MIIKDLPPGTKLMWDAPLPFPGYKNLNSTQKDRIVYPMIITNRIPKIPELGKHLKSSSSGNWMGFENENLRLPTEEELNTLKWPDIEMKLQWCSFYEFHEKLQNVEILQKDTVVKCIYCKSKYVVRIPFVNNAYKCVACKEEFIIINEDE